MTALLVIRSSLSKWRSTILSLGLMLVSSTSYALAFGEIEIHSRLGEQLNASIPISATQTELAELEVTIASKAIYKRMEIERGTLAQDLDIQLINNNGAAQIQVTSNKMIKEPLLEFVLSAYWGNGNTTRLFTILLSP